MYLFMVPQLKDIKELSERIDAQVVLMRNAYEAQLNLIESAIEMERALTIEYNRKRWEALYKKRDKEEMTNIHQKIEKVIYNLSGQFTFECDEGLKLVESKALDT